MLNEALLKEGFAVYPDLDAIMDLFDLSYVWASPKVLALTGYDEDEFLHLRSLDVINKEKNDEAAYRKAVVERLKKKEGTDTVHLHNKEGKKLIITMKYRIVEFQRGWYMLAVVTSSDPE